MSATNSILVNVTGQETRLALLENGQVVEVHVERRKHASLAGNIYKGKVLRILPGMRSAFVDIALEKAAFLYVADIRADIMEDYALMFEDENFSSLDFLHGKCRHELQIDELLHEGQEILVQVSKNPIGGKGARVTSYVTLPGRYLVLMPDLEHVGISRRISDEQERARLKEVVEAIRPPGFGLIVRTASEGAIREELQKDLDFLISLWGSILRKNEKSGAPALIYNDLDLVLRSVRDLMGSGADEMVLDSAARHLEVSNFVRNYFPKLLDKIRLYDGEEPLFESYAIEADITRALGRKVWLKSGGYIVMDQTEAMSVIDVNTGKYVGKKDLEDTILRTNLEAVKEIAYQIRLRNLGGIIIVDFIDMEKPENRQKIMSALQDAMKKDRAKSTISQITELGLIQMTRKRVRESLQRTLLEPCPYCEGKGTIKSVTTLCYEIFRETERIARHGSKRIVITAHPSVAEILLDEERQWLEEIEGAYGMKVTINENPALHQENYEINAL
ncbi:MAG: Rne/Rng family ribonuclease [Nitrospiraceae bacterium]|nr:Rne/Rng family ribonuclease [Nitrospiraceae bacterium]